jgi:transcriptional regulator GlxA family with amidase domain
VIEHYARLPIEAARRIDPVGHGRIVYRAQEFTRANLNGPISLDDLATAAGTSRRTVARAFVEVLGDTPASYVRRLRLHRIRRDLVRNAAGYAIREIAAAWGIGEPGRMAGQYRDLFGEYPHDTLKMHLIRRKVGV